VNTETQKGCASGNRTTLTTCPARKCHRSQRCLESHSKLELRPKLPRSCFASLLLDLMDVTRDPKLLDEIWKPLEQPTCNRITNKRGLMSPSVSNYCIRKALCRLNCPNGIIILALCPLSTWSFQLSSFRTGSLDLKDQGYRFFRVSCLLACLPACPQVPRTYSTIMRD
jgi:hypothetical protein